MSQATRILGCNPLTARYVYSCISFNANSLFEQSVRWKRKPIWLPTAKSKIFKIPERPVVPLEEAVEMKRLFNQYRTVVKSVRRHLIKTVEENKVELDPVLIEKAKEDDFIACSAINDEWNENLSIIREERIAKEQELKMEKISNAIEKYKAKKEEQLIKATEEIRKAKELTANLITSSNIDEAIEEALKNVVDYNYAIDADGNKFHGNELDANYKEISTEKVAKVSQ